jgi:hypothetical protein
MLDRNAPRLALCLLFAACVPVVEDESGVGPGDSSELHRSRYRTHASLPTTTDSSSDAATTHADGGVSSPDLLSASADLGTAPGTRDPLKQPFASNSIWNMPIGSGAVYVPANMKPVPGGSAFALPWSDDEYLILKPTAPLVDVRYSSAGWGGDRCQATGTQVLASVPIPQGFVVPSSGTNASTAILAANGHTLIQVQPLARCAAGGFATSLVRFTDVEITGDGIVGAHGGSGMSAIGGTIRLGELRPGQAGPRHALKVALYMKEAFKCTTAADCYRWPAKNADSYAVGFYGTGSSNPNVSNTAFKMGALLAIPAGVDVATLALETEPGKQLAWTLQNYGAYVVDDAYDAAFYLDTEVSPDGSFRDQFQADYGFAFNQGSSDNTAWVRDMKRLLPALNIVNNNSASSIGGGGTPRQPLAPPL